MRLFLLLISILMIVFSPAKAQEYAGAATVRDGGTSIIKFDEDCLQSFSDATQIVYQWSSYDSSYFKILDSAKDHATIGGVKTTEFPIRLHYLCSGYSNGQHFTIDKYFEVSVVDFLDSEPNEYTTSELHIAFAGQIYEEDNMSSVYTMQGLLKYVGKNPEQANLPKGIYLVKKGNQVYKTTF